MDDFYLFLFLSHRIDYIISQFLPFSLSKSLALSDSIVNLKKQRKTDLFTLENPCV